MKNLTKLLFVVALVTAAIISTPRTAMAIPWCEICEESDYTDCFACCKCDGNSTAICAQICP